jgi:hypothetical protein
MKETIVAVVQCLLILVFAGLFMALLGRRKK